MDSRECILTAYDAKEGTRVDIAIRFRVSLGMVQKLLFLPLVLTSNKAFGDRASVFANDHVMASALLDRLLHKSTIINIRGDSCRLKEKRLAGINIVFFVKP